jgi:hypothetical protein
MRDRIPLGFRSWVLPEPTLEPATLTLDAIEVPTTFGFWRGDALQIRDLRQEVTEAELRWIAAAQLAVTPIPATLAPVRLYLAGGTIRLVILQFTAVVVDYQVGVSGPLHDWDVYLNVSSVGEVRIGSTLSEIDGVPQSV